MVTILKEKFALRAQTKASLFSKKFQLNFCTEIFSKTQAITKETHTVNNLADMKNEGIRVKKLIVNPHQYSSNKSHHLPKCKIATPSKIIF